MSLRGRAVAYLVVLHGMFAALGVYLFRHNPFWLLGVEAVFAVSIMGSKVAVPSDAPRP